MSGPKRNPDNLNTFGVVVVGISAAAMVYVAITALQAFYMNDSSEIQTMADYGGQDVTAKGHKSDELQHITRSPSQVATQPTPMGDNAAPAPTYQIDIGDAMKLVVASAKSDPTHLIPSLPSATKATIEPVFGRPKPLGAAAPAAPTTAPAAPAGAGSAAAAPAAGSAGDTANLAAPSSTAAPGVAGGSGPGVSPGAATTPGAGAAAATGSAGGHAP